MLAIANGKRRVAITITQAILNGAVTAAFRYFACQDRDEWSDAIPLEHSGSIVYRHQHLDMSGLSDGEISANAEIRRRASLS